MSRRSLALLLAGASAIVFAGPLASRLSGAPVPSRPSPPPSPAAAAQDQAPNRRDFTIVAREVSFSPDRIEVTQDDLVKITVSSNDTVHSFTIDEYRIVKRIPAGGAVTFEFRADRAGTFPFYCNLTGDSGHSEMRGQLVVRAK